MIMISPGKENFQSVSKSFRTFAINSRKEHVTIDLITVIALLVDARMCRMFDPLDLEYIRGKVGPLSQLSEHQKGYETLFI